MALSSSETTQAHELLVSFFGASASTKVTFSNPTAGFAPVTSGWTVWGTKNLSWDDKTVQATGVQAIPRRSICPH